jgi:hypothetical protein
VLTFQVTFPHIVPTASLSKAQVSGPAPSVTVCGGAVVKTAAEAPAGTIIDTRRSAIPSDFGFISRR